MKTNLSKLSRRTLLCAFALTPLLGLTALAQPNTTAAMGQKFAEPKAAKTLRVLVAGAGSSHDFPKYFLGSDVETLKAAGGFDIAATPNLEEALALIPMADVIVFSGNHDQWGRVDFQKALNDHADAGKGVVLLHAATWVHPWPDYNKRFVGGGSKGHGKGDFEVDVKKPKNALMEGVPGKFKIYDESYKNNFDADAKVEVLAENHADGEEHASVWIVKDKKAKIVCITLGHDDKAHDNPAYKSILINAVKLTAK